MFITALILLFIIKIRFPKGKSIHQIIEHWSSASTSASTIPEIKKCGRPLLLLFRKLKNVDLKTRKADCDKEFLHTCLNDDLTPKFVNFKLYRKDIRTTQRYRAFQKTVLNNEYTDKANKLEKLTNERNKIVLQLKNIVSILDFNHLVNFINSVNDNKVSKIQHTQNKKLFNSGLHHEVPVTRLNPQKLIFNYSDKILTPDEIETLSHFLKFALLERKIIPVGFTLLKICFSNWRIANFLIQATMDLTISRVASNILPSRIIIPFVLMLTPYNINS